MMNKEILEEWIKQTENSIDHYERAIEHISAPELRARYEIATEELTRKLEALEYTRQQL